MSVLLSECDKILSTLRLFSVLNLMWLIIKESVLMK